MKTMIAILLAGHLVGEDGQLTCHAYGNCPPGTPNGVVTDPMTRSRERPKLYVDCPTRLSVSKNEKGETLITCAPWI